MHMSCDLFSEDESILTTYYLKEEIHLIWAPGRGGRT